MVRKTEEKTEKKSASSRCNSFSLLDDKYVRKLSTKHLTFGESSFPKRMIYTIMRKLSAIVGKDFHLDKEERAVVLFVLSKTMPIIRKGNTYGIIG